MRIALLVLAVTALTLAPTSVARADFINLHPAPADLHDLDHYKYYTWGISAQDDVPLIVLSSAVLHFDNIRNWDNKPNDLYVHLLDWAPDGVTVGRDNQGGGDNFAGQGILLAHYEDLPNTPQDLTYVFDAAEMTTLNGYFQNGGDFALGFDPDCHYYNRGVTLRLGYELLPEPGSLVVIVTGAIGALLRRRRK